MKKLLLLTLVVLCCTHVFAQRVIVNGVPWYDDRDSIVCARGANILYDNGVYYLYGEYKVDNSNRFNGVSCYTSKDLCNWTWAGLALDIQKDGRLGANTVGQRPKVLRCPYSGEYVMYISTNNMDGTDPVVCYAVSTRPTGPFTFKGPVKFANQPLKRTDIGVYYDEEKQRGYLLAENGEIYALSIDYHSCMNLVHRIKDAAGLKSPAMFYRDGYFYFIGSKDTGWESNDNVYFTSKFLFGPWQSGGTLAPAGTGTWNSQTSYVFQYTYDGHPYCMFMGDRWSYPLQHSAASYVWLPLMVDGVDLRLSRFREMWDPFYGRTEDISKFGSVDSINCGTSLTKPGETYDVNIKVRPNGRIMVSGVTSKDGGYAEVELQQVEGFEQVEANVSFYSPRFRNGIVYMSPELPKGLYHITIKVKQLRPSWTSKDGTTYGSTGNKVSIQKIYSVGK